jgi:dUTPase
MRPTAHSFISGLYTRSPDDAQLGCMNDTTDDEPLSDILKGAILDHFAISPLVRPVGPVRTTLLLEPEGLIHLYAAQTDLLQIARGDRATIRTGWAIQVPRGFRVEVESLPALVRERGLTVLTWEELGRERELVVMLHNRDPRVAHHVIIPNMRIARLVIKPIATITALRREDTCQTC